MRDKRETACILCSLGCGFMIETCAGEAVNLEYNPHDPVGRGALCGKGNYALELLNHPDRMIEPRMRGRALTWNEALIRIVGEFAGFGQESSVGIVLAGDASLEDVVTAKLFADTCMNEGWCAVHFATPDHAVYRGINEAGVGNTMAGMDDIEKSAFTISVGDPFEVGPVIAGRMLAAKYAGRKNRLAVIADHANRTARFADVHLDGAVRRNLAGLLRVVAERSDTTSAALKELVINAFPLPKDQRIVELGNEFVSTPKAILVLETQDPLVARLAALVVRAAGSDKRLYNLGSYANAGGIVDVLGDTGSVDDVIRSVARGKLKVLIVLGADIVRGLPEKEAGIILEKLDMLIAGAPFENETTRMADIVLPTALWMESAGTFRGKMLNPVIDPPGGARSYGAIVRSLAEELGKPLPAVSTERVAIPEKDVGDLVNDLIKNIDKEALEPLFRSTVTGFADGSLTDTMSWVLSGERNAW